MDCAGAWSTAKKQSTKIDVDIFRIALIPISRVFQRTRASRGAGSLVYFNWTIVLKHIPSPRKLQAEFSTAEFSAGGAISKDCGKRLVLSSSPSISTRGTPSYPSSD
jgi:hypothetical protein